jgi:hypothetical protein
MPRIETSSPHPSCVETRGDESLAKRIVMAARSVKVQFETEGMPNTKLVLVGSGLSHGEWSSGLQPPESLPPGFAIEWQSESDGFLTGTQVGFVITPLPRAATHQQTRLLKTPSTSRGITRTAGAIRTRRLLRPRTASAADLFSITTRTTKWRSSPCPCRRAPE